MDYIRISQRSTVNGQQSLFINDIKELLKDWIKLYPNSFAPDVEFKIYQLADGDFIIELHEDLSSMAVSLLVLYFENCQQTTDNRQQTFSTAYVTIDDAEVLLKQNEGKRAMICCRQTTDNGQQMTADTESEFNSQSSTAKVQSSTSVRFLLEDDYCLDYNFEGRPKPVKDSGLQFSELEFTLPEEYEVVRVGDVVKKKIDEILDEGLTPKKMLIYLLCAAIGLSIGFLIVYFMGR